jgi:hypothetical protein
MIRYIYLFFYKLCNFDLNDELEDGIDRISEIECAIMGEYSENLNRNQNHIQNHNEYFKFNSTYHEEHV